MVLIGDEMQKKKMIEMALVYFKDRRDSYIVKGIVFKKR